MNISRLIKILNDVLADKGDIRVLAMLHVSQEDALAMDPSHVSVFTLENNTDPVAALRCFPTDGTLISKDLDEEDLPKVVN